MPKPPVLREDHRAKPPSIRDKCSPPHHNSAELPPTRRVPRHPGLTITRDDLRLVITPPPFLLSLSDLISTRAFPPFRRPPPSLAPTPLPTRPPLLRPSTPSSSRRPRLPPPLPTFSGRASPAPKPAPPPSPLRGPPPSFDPPTHLYYLPSPLYTLPSTPPPSPNIADRHARLHRLGNDGQLQIRREAPPAGDAGNHFDLRERVGHRRMPRLIPRPSG